jgi:hypothetical protein
MDESVGSADNKNFEIINDSIIFRQEVIGQSIGGLNLYQLTFTSTQWARNVKK